LEGFEFEEDLAAMKSLVMDFHDMQKSFGGMSYQPACFERMVEWMRGVSRHGVGRALGDWFAVAMLSK
jgi:hypothetical protein